MRQRKEQACGCAGIYTAHAALELYAEAFEDAGQLDRLGADLWLFAIALALITVLSTYVLLQGHADFDAAIAHHGSMLAYLVCALQFGSYGATLVVLVVQAGRGGRGFE